jgi:hypothetical protein
MVGNTLVIGLGHKARHGKNAAADAIHEAYPAETRIYSFANALKAFCRVAYGMTAKNAPLLQRVGLEFRERSGADFWVDILKAQLLEEQPKVALVTDVRFPNEAAFCDAAVKVTRLVGGVPFVAQDRPADHPSETALDGYDGWYDELVVEDGKLEALREAALRTYGRFIRDAQALAWIPTEGYAKGLVEGDPEGALFRLRDEEAA